MTRPTERRGGRGRGRRRWWRSRWWTPTLSLLLGGLILAASWIGGSLGDGLRALAVMAAVALLFLVGSRSDTLRGLGGPGRDERWALIDTRATAFAGAVLAVAILALWLYEVADGRDGRPNVQLGALAGIAYIAAVAWLRRRS